MKILHYSLGFPPYRTGGMTKYCMDLIEEQLNMGQEVSLLWPGKIKEYSSKEDIKCDRKHKINGSRYCNSFEMINPLPISLLDGIKNIKTFTQEKDINKFYEFFSKEKFDVMHVHTLMGLPKECIIAARKMNVKLVFTTHDYFGLCPRGSFIYKDSVCDDFYDCKNCAYCNRNALSLKKIKFMQSHFYKLIKNFEFVKLLRRKQRLSFRKLDNEAEVKLYDESDNKKTECDYKKLREYYIGTLKLFDVIHFNSSVTKSVYEQFLGSGINSRTISISHREIANNKNKKSSREIINFSYLASCTRRKGIFLIKEAFDEIYKKYSDKFLLHVYTSCPVDAPYIIKHEKYNYNQLGNVMEKADMVIVPSVWKETFGFTVLEALSYGVPVMVSENVGAKDIVEDNKSGIIVDVDTKKIVEEIERIIKNPVCLEEMNKYILENVKIKNIQQHCNEIINLYKEV